MNIPFIGMALGLPILAAYQLSAYRKLGLG
jgi:hypothetical protein